MARAKKDDNEPRLTREWLLPAAATLGSSVRAKGIMLETRAKMPLALRKAVDVRAGAIVLSMPESAAAEFANAAGIVETVLAGAEDQKVIPREIEDILGIKTAERHRWLKDGRLISAGTRTIKLRGRARKITFHVFDPRHVEDLLDSGVIDDWREQDAETARENRRRAAWQRKLAKAEKAGKAAPDKDGERVQLMGWAEFERSGLLR
jgi:hypothetical protein